MGLAFSSEGAWTRANPFQAFLDKIDQEAKRWVQIVQHVRTSNASDIREVLKVELTSTHFVMGQAIDNYDAIIGRKIATPVAKKQDQRQRPKTSVGSRGSGKNDMEELVYHNQAEVKRLNNLVERMEKDYNKSESVLRKTENERDGLLTRLSKIAGSQLRRENSAITDLSDPNRPSKLGETYKQIYDNEWTDAFVKLDRERGEREAIDILHHTLLDIMRFCERKSNVQLELLTKAMVRFYKDEDDPSGSREALYDKWSSKTSRPSTAKRTWKGDKSENCPDFSSVAKTIRKTLAVDNIEVLQDAYVGAYWTDACVPEMKPFIEKCIAVCWLMTVQSPPMVLEQHRSDVISDKTGNGSQQQAAKVTTAKSRVDVAFDVKLYDFYTTTGKHLDYIVWPPVRIEVGGQLVCKGVAQGK